MFALDGVDDLLKDFVENKKKIQFQTVRDVRKFYNQMREGGMTGVSNCVVACMPLIIPF